MNKFKLVAGVILLLIVGMLAGSLGTGIYYKKRVERFESGGPPVSERVRIVLGRFSDDLKLTKEQRDEIGKIVRESQEKILALGRETLPQIEAINEQTLSSIQEKLSSEQRNKLNELYQRMKDFRKRSPEQNASPKRTPEQGQRQMTPDAAPPNGTPDSMPFQKDDTRFFDSLKERLNLSREQEEKVRSIMEASDKERKRLLDKYRGDLGEIEASLEKSLSNILTKEQMDKYRTANDRDSFERPPQTP
jgi:Spy/CpxP family protein refolding chaperone